MTPDSETEFKLRLDANSSRKIGDLASHYSAKPKSTRLHSAYFDDKTGRLAKSGLELRVRKAGRRTVQTVKSGGGICRGEWEKEIDGDTPSLEAAKATPAKAIFKKTRKLRPIFDVDVERRAWTIDRNGARIELAVDSGEIACNGAREPISEAEFELKRGPPRAFFLLVREAIESCDAPLSFVSKGLRGRRLAAGVAHCPDGDIDLTLDRAATVSDAFRMIVAACLRQESINEELLREDPSDVEAVHEMRVAIRRLRAALSLFAPAMEEKESRRLKAELKWLSDALGQARDLDVFLQGPIALLGQQHPDVEGVEELRGAFSVLRDGAHDRLKRAIHSLRFRRLQFDLAKLCATGGGPPFRADGGAPFVEFAAKEYDRRLSKIAKKKSAAIIAGADERKRHRLRIRMKKLRYMIEFARPLARAKSFARIAGALKEAQRSLGVIHDRIAAEQTLSHVVAKSDDAGLGFAANILRDETATSTDCARMALQAHAALRRATPFWRSIA